MSFLTLLFLFIAASLHNPQVRADSDEIFEPGKPVYIDPDLPLVTVGSKPGVTWQMCQKNPKFCIAWPDSNSNLIPTSSKIRKVEVRNPITGVMEEKAYIEVSYDYTREVAEGKGSKKTINQKGTGWLPVEVLRAKRLEPIYITALDPKKIEKGPKKNGSLSQPGESCNQTGQQSRKNNEILKDISNQFSKDPISKLNSSVDLLKPIIGQCPLTHPDKKPADSWKGRNIYDSEALPLVQKASSRMPKIPKEVSPGQFGFATKEDLISIDTLARTLYAEMNECFAKGLQFPMAAAKVAVNRAKLADAGNAPATYVGNSRQVSSKPNLAKVLTAPWQFSVWNPSGAANPRDKTALMALCPTRDSGKKNWKGHQSTPDDLYAWEKSLQIATEAVLYPNQFERKTNNVTQLYYTSKRTQFLNQDYKKPRPAPQIEGRPVDSFQCMYLWEKSKN